MFSTPALSGSDPMGMFSAPFSQGSTPNSLNRAAKVLQAERKTKFISHLGKKITTFAKL
jgi:hypothetical protein